MSALGDRRLTPERGSKFTYRSGCVVLSMDESANGDTVRLRDVFFSYDRDTNLPTDGLGPVPDPDSRGGLVLRGVDLDIPTNSFSVVMGASGGGKSTLVRTVNAIIPSFIRGQFRGEIKVLGTDVTRTRVSEMARRVGMVLQDYEAQLFGTSVEAEVAFGPENLAVPVDEIADRIDTALDTVGLATLDRRREPAGLSGGQKQRLVLASVLAMHPTLLVLDEPTSDLDPRGTRDILDIVARLAGSEHDTGPSTIVMVTHKIEEALLADRAILLKDGRVYRDGPTRVVFTDIDSLRACRVAVPPLVDAFDRLGLTRDELPLTPGEAATVVARHRLDWTPPARRGESLPGVPAGTGTDVGGTVFELDGVVHDYHTDQGAVRAVDDVDLSIRRGEVVAIVGQNGSGKTTLAKHLNGLLTPDDGTVTWAGRDVTSLSMAEIGRNVGYLFQNPDHQLFARTVREEVSFGPKNFGITGETLETRVSRAISAVELDPLEEADPFNLSKGQRQRVALASVLATDPEVIVFDEPTTGLDAIQQRRFMDMVAELNRHEQLTVVMVTHDMPTVARYAPRTVVLRDGQKVADRPTRDLFAGDLGRWDLTAPHVVDLSNRLGDDNALPALSVDELVAGLGESS